MGTDRESVQAGYDKVAIDYGREFDDELAGKPLDRWLLGRVVERSAGAPIVDIGCGPGQVTQYLASLGGNASGIDLSAGMIAEARRRVPALSFEQGDMRALRSPAGGWAAIVAFYSIIHLEPDELPAVFAGFLHALRPGGVLLVAAHAGDDRVHRDDWWGHAVSLDFVFQDPERLRASIDGAGFSVDEVIVRSPYVGAEHPTERVYILASRPLS
jgi:uncharacterized protein